MKKSLPTLAVLAFFAACSPFQDKDITLPAQPAAPDFSVEILAADPNRVVVKDLSTGFFDRAWAFPGGVPTGSKRAIDTVFFPKQGDYLISLHAAGEGGGGVSSASKSVQIANNAGTTCDPQLALLTGDCLSGGKCWTFSHAANAVIVGPTPGSNEWYKSPVNGLQAAQYDDQFCFFFDGSSFVYKNNDTTVDPWNGYAVVSFTPPTDLTYFISKGTGDGGLDQIVLPAGAFIGTWDSGSTYDIASLTEDKLVLRSPLRTQSGATAAGWFEFTLIKV